VIRPFALYTPATLAEAAGLLAEKGGEAALYAGGTELLILLKEGLLRVETLVNLKRIPGLAEIRGDDGHLSIGATATHRSLERAEAVRARCPIVAEVARHVANIRVRTVGTVGGNLAFADPHSDLATLFLALDAEVRLVGPARERRLPVADFVRGSYETAREEDEVLADVRLTPWPAGTAAAYVKFGVHERPTLGVAVALTVAGAAVTGARIAVGCVGPRPRRVPAAEERARGMAVGDLGRHAAELAALATREVDAVSDLHGSADYKREMARVFVRRALDIAAARAAGRVAHERYPHTVVV
jgi:carbon-monoxide dehydrogenase medium subunit